MSNNNSTIIQNSKDATATTEGVYNTKKVKYLKISLNIFVILTVYGAVDMFIKQLPYDITQQYGLAGIIAIPFIFLINPLSGTIIMSVLELISNFVLFFLILAIITNGQIKKERRNNKIINHN